MNHPLNDIAMLALKEGQRIADTGKLTAAVAKFREAEDLFAEAGNDLRQREAMKAAVTLENLLQAYTDTALEAYNLGMSEHARRRYTDAAAAFRLAETGFRLAGDSIGEREAALCAEDAEDTARAAVSAL